MADNFELDTASLASFLVSRIDGFRGPLTVEKFAGGQSNPTYLLSAASGRYVLRRKPPGQLLASAHAVDREYRVISALAATDVPVPGVHLLCKDESVIGSMFYVMDFVEGRILWNPALPDQSPAERTAMYDEMNRVLARLHSVNVGAAGLADYGRAGNYFERQVARWTTQYRASETEFNPAMESLITWLNDNMPSDEGRVSLIHGDYRLDNVIFHPTEPRVLAILDWELSTLGNPLADLAWQCMQLRLPTSAAIPGLGSTDRAMLGIPSEEDYVQGYCERSGLNAIENWAFYIAFSYFRLASILQGIQKRALDGNASSQKAFDYGALAKPLSEMGWKSVV